MQHFFAQEVEAGHLRRELERQIEAHSLIARACPENRQTRWLAWRGWDLARWRSLAGVRFVIAPFLPRPSH